MKQYPYTCTLRGGATAVILEFVESEPVYKLRGRIATPGKAPFSAFWTPTGQYSNQPSEYDIVESMT